MKGIVVYSKTGNTKMVAEEIAKKGSLPLHVVLPVNDDPQIKEPELKESPDITAYDHVILGSPVHGFMLANVMRVYIEKTDFTQKKVDLFITHFFPFAWMGGTHTLKQMKKLVEKKGGEVHLMIPINWKNKKREQDIKNLVEKYSS
ncbi:MAG: flavodoxin domain-containing protein [Acholeplasmataceae bacterium]|jgi:flavodoxin|nr:flavodoxin domain-containing protein [Acholeplasmataceae bacterium]